MRLICVILTKVRLFKLKPWDENFLIGLLLDFFTRTWQNYRIKLTSWLSSWWVLTLKISFLSKIYQKKNIHYQNALTLLVNIEGEVNTSSIFIFFVNLKQKLMIVAAFFYVHAKTNISFLLIRNRLLISNNRLCWHP